MQTRIQVQTSIEGGARYSGIISSLVTIYREEGLRGWYHGFTPAVCSVAVFWTCYFPCYDYAKTSIAEASGLPMTSSLVHMSAAAGAGLLTDVITNPLWVIRTRLATQRLRVVSSSSSSSSSSGGSGGGAPAAGAAAAAAVPSASSGAATSATATATATAAASSSSTAAASTAAAPARPPLQPRVQYHSMRHAFVTICAEEGWIALFSGLSASILGLSHIMIQFPLYERIKDELAARYPHRRPAPAEPPPQQHHRQQRRAQPPPPPAPPSPLWHIIAASGVSKLIASTITYPHEVIRARLQFDQGGQLYSGLLDATRKTLLHDGLAGLWLGFNLNIVRTIPQCVVTFTLYEYLSRRLQLAFGLTSEGLSEGRHPQQQKQIKMVTLARSESRG